MAVDQLSGALEDNILTVLVWNEQYAAEVAMRVPSEIYSTRAYQKIAQAAAAHLEKYHKPPRAHIRDLLEQDIGRGDEGRFLAQVLDAMEGLQADIQPEYVLQQLDRFIQQQRLKEISDRISDSLHVGDLESALEAFAEAGVAGTTTEHPRVWFNDSSRWLSFLQEDERELFSSGVDVLDERGVRPRRGGLFLTIGSAGAGKSWWLVEIGKRNLVEYGRSVLHITLENDIEETQQRYTQSLLACTAHEAESRRITTFKRDKLGRYTTTDFAEVQSDALFSLSHEEIDRRLRPYRRRGRLLIQWFPSGTLTISQLSAYLDMLERVDGFRPDVIIVDYANLMQVPQRDYRIGLGRNLVSLRGIAGQRRAAVVTATQGNRYSATAKLVGTNMVAEDWSMIGTADVVCTYSQTMMEKGLGLARILVGKARRVPDKWIAQITQSYDTGQFCLDSVYFNKMVASDVSRLTGEDDEDDGEAEKAKK